MAATVAGIYLTATVVAVAVPLLLVPTLPVGLLVLVVPVLPTASREHLSHAQAAAVVVALKAVAATSLALVVQAAAALVR